MKPKTADQHSAVESLAEELLVEEGLSELDVEDLIGHHVEFDEQDDWRALDF